MAELTIPVSIGEAADKITILQIKSARIEDAGKRANVQRELDALEGLFAAAFPTVDDKVTALIAALKQVNETLWDIEDEIRDHERRRAFDESFIRLARSVYVQNDKRAAIKRDINLALGSSLIEEKSYAGY